MTDSAKKALLVLGISLVLIWLIKPRKHKEQLMQTEPIRKKITVPTVTDQMMAKHSRSEDAIVALNAYVDAWNNGEEKETLDKINKDLVDEMKVKVYQTGDEISGYKFSVKDLKGNEILNFKTS